MDAWCVELGVCIGDSCIEQDLAATIPLYGHHIDAWVLINVRALSIAVFAILIDSALVTYDLQSIVLQVLLHLKTSTLKRAVARSCRNDCVAGCYTICTFLLLRVLATTSVR